MPVNYLIRSRRWRLGLTQAQLAKKCNLGLRTVQAVEHDHGSNRSTQIVLNTIQELEAARNYSSLSSQ